MFCVFGTLNGEDYANIKHQLRSTISVFFSVQIRGRPPLRSVVKIRRRRNTCNHTYQRRWMKSNGPLTLPRTKEQRDGVTMWVYENEESECVYSCFLTSLSTSFSTSSKKALAMTLSEAYVCLALIKLNKPTIHARLG